MIEFGTFLIILTAKALMMGTDPSTDFEVHRNWKALTNSLHISNWYYDETSYWTLDYPPIFAYMEFILGKISKLFDEKITDIQNLEYKAFSCIIYQRVTVLFSDFLMFLAIKKLSNVLNLNKTNRIFLIILIHSFAGLVIVDNLHFQYNTLLYAIMIISICYVFENEFIKAAIIYSILLNMKHIFLYIAPAYFVYFLKFYVLKNNTFHFFRLIKLGCVIVLVFALSFLPFIMIAIDSKSPEIFMHILSRLFPFKRGLIHSYWAPNFWCLYTFIDKILFFLISNFKIEGLYKFLSTILNLEKYENFIAKNLNLSSIGKTQEIKFNILPNIEPKHVNLLIITLSMILISSMFFYSAKKTTNLKEQRFIFTKYLILSSFIFYNFGFHVHEKAFIIISILIIIHNFISFSDENLDEERKTDDIYSIIKVFMFKSILYIGSLSQMPLIQSKKDYFIKLTLVLTYLVFVEFYCGFRKFSLKNDSKNKNVKRKSQIFKWFINLLLFSFILIVLICDFIFVFLNRNEFEKEYDLYFPIYMNLNKTETSHVAYLNRISSENIILNITNTFPFFENIFNILLKYEFLPLMVISVINSIFVQLVNILALALFFMN